MQGVRLSAITLGLFAWQSCWEYYLCMSWQEWIELQSDVRSGKPCIKGTRITVYDILEYLAGGMSEQDILKDFPSLRLEHVRATLAFAADRERRLSAPPAA